MGFLFGSQSGRAEAPTRMPAGNDAVVRQARERQRRAIGNRTGRSSTMLTSANGGGNAGGTQSYTNSLLGSA